jgi:co-chaperonin GroES (HSP10)
MGTSKKVKEKKPEFANGTDRIPEGFDDSDLRIKGYPMIPSGDRVIIQPIDNASLVHKGTGLILIEGKDNQSKLCKIVAISPDLFNKVRYPFMIYKPGDIAYFNHLAGNYMRLKFMGDMHEYYCMYIMDLFALFTGNQEEYFGQDLSKISEGDILKSIGAGTEIKLSN